MGRTLIWGITVFLPVHAVVWDTDHIQNGKDLQAFATFIGDGAPIIRWAIRRGFGCAIGRLRTVIPKWC